MKISDPNLHMRLQEMCDCYLETDFAKQLDAMVKAPSRDIEEEGVKYLALAIMYGVNERVEKLKMKKKKDGSLKASMVMGDEKISLPLPSVELFDRIVAIIREILHFEEDGGQLPLVLGLRDSQIELLVNLKFKGDEVSLKFSFS